MWLNTKSNRLNCILLNYNYISYGIYDSKSDVYQTRSDIMCKLNKFEQIETMRGKINEKRQGFYLID